MANMLMTVTGGGQPFSPYPTEVQEFGHAGDRVLEDLELGGATHDT